jgi:hypothetical protein
MLFILSEILDSHTGDYEDDSLLTLTVLMMETVSTTETLVNFYETKRRCVPEDCHLVVHFNITG